MNLAFRFKEGWKLEIRMMASRGESSQNVRSTLGGSGYRHPTCYLRRTSGLETKKKKEKRENRP